MRTEILTRSEERRLLQLIYDAPDQVLSVEEVQERFDGAHRVAKLLEQRFIEPAKTEAGAAVRLTMHGLNRLIELQETKPLIWS